MHNSPNRTADWFGWANAVITELIPTAALIIIARRRRTGASIGYPMFLLVVAVLLSMTAQLAVAQPSVFGWMVSALPALAFFALSKLVFTATRPTQQPQQPRPSTTVPAVTPAPVAPAPSADIAPATGRPAARKTTAAKPRTTPGKTPAKKTTTPQRTPAKKTTTPAAAPAIPAVPVPAEPGTAAPVSSGLVELLPGARLVVDSHRQAHGEPITPGQLAVRMRVPTTTAEQILNHLNQLIKPTTTGPHNGAPIGARQ
jgi:hypothetical protein